MLCLGIAFLSMHLTVCVKWKSCADVSTCEICVWLHGAVIVCGHVSVLIVCMKRDCVFLCDAMMWYSWVWDIGWRDNNCNILYGWVIWTLMCEFAYMTSSEMCMAVTLDTSCLAGWVWSSLLWTISCLAVSWVWPSLGTVGSEWLDACLECASLFLYNAWAMTISVSVWLWREECPYKLVDTVSKCEPV